MGPCSAPSRRAKHTCSDEAESTRAHRRPRDGSIGAAAGQSEKLARSTSEDRAQAKGRIGTGMWPRQEWSVPWARNGVIKGWATPGMPSAVPGRLRWYCLCKRFRSSGSGQAVPGKSTRRKGNSIELRTSRSLDLVSLQQEWIPRVFVGNGTTS